MPLEWKGRMRADDLTIPWEKHFTDYLMACVQKPHGFSVQLAAPLADRKLVIYVQTEHEGMVYNHAVHMIVPEGMPRGAPTEEFLYYVQGKINAMAESMRRQFCEFYKTP